MQCPNCSVEFAEHRETAWRCETCGWLRQVDGTWHTCLEPPIQEEPVVQDVPVPETKPAEPEVDNQPTKTGDRLPAPGHGLQLPIITSYLGGYVTVTEIDDEQEPEDE